jgi:hypothetical protein
VDLQRHKYLYRSDGLFDARFLLLERVKSSGSDATFIEELPALAKFTFTLGVTLMSPADECSALTVLAIEGADVGIHFLQLFVESDSLLQLRCGHKYL